MGHSVMPGNDYSPIVSLRGQLNPQKGSTVPKLIGNYAQSIPENAGYTGSIMRGGLSDRALKSGKGYTYDVKLAFTKGYQH